MAMLYLQKNDENDQSGALRSFVLLIVAFIVALTFVPGLPKGVAVGHEWATPNHGAPLMLPLARPVYLNRGETLTIDYRATVRRGRFVLGVTHAANPALLFFAPPPRTIVSQGISGAGTASFTAREAGWHLVRISVEPGGGSSHSCQNAFGDFLDAALAKNTGCPTANASYALIVY